MLFYAIHCIKDNAKMKHEDSFALINILFNISWWLSSIVHFELTWNMS